GRGIMMAPSVGQRLPSKECNNTSNAPLFITDQNGDGDKNSESGIRSGSNTNSLRRNSWLRTSLKRTSKLVWTNYSSALEN
ncbi:unnamed protein product, partial [Nesidiocoris tenuis]